MVPTRKRWGSVLSARPRSHLPLTMALSFMLLSPMAGARLAQGATGASRVSDRVPTVSKVAPTACPGVPGTEVDMATLSHNTQLDSTCYSALANVPLVLVFVNETIALSGTPLSLGLSLYHSPDDGYTVTDNGTAFLGHPEKAIFRGDEVSAPGSIDYQVPALPPGTYWIQADPIAPIMNAWLVLQSP